MDITSSSFIDSYTGSLTTVDLVITVIYTVQMSSLITSHCLKVNITNYQSLSEGQHH